MLSSVHVMLNPVAGAGSAGRLEVPIVRGLESRGFGSVVLIRSTEPLSLQAAARDAAAKGAKLIVAVGGDGTINEVINGILSAPNKASDVTLGIINAGTGQGLAKGLGLPASLEDQLDVVAGGRTRSIDVAKLEYTSKSESGAKSVTRYFINECEIGIGAEIIRRTTPALKRLGGTLSFGIASLGLLPTGYARGLRIQPDNHAIEGKYLGITVANGPIAGGSMLLAPEAKLDDGLLDMVCFRRTSFARKVYTFSRVYSGKHIGTAGVESLQSSWLRVESDEPTAIAVDGELVGETPCTISIVRSAIQIKVPFNN